MVRHVLEYKQPLCLSALKFWLREQAYEAGNPRH